jgi:N-acetylglutamate synthase-like GNAT family acetyltransferase
VISIRKARRDDTDTLFNIRTEAIRAKCIDHYTDEQIELWTEGKPSEKFSDLVEQHFYLATINHVTAASGMVNLSTGMIDAIFVHPDFMGQGAAKSMLHHLEQQAKEAGLKELLLDSTLNAASFYRSCGFEGDKISTYESSRGISLDCIPMRKHL